MRWRHRSGVFSFCFALRNGPMRTRSWRSISTAFSSAAAPRTSISGTLHWPPLAFTVATTRPPSRTYPARALAGEQVNAAEAAGDSAVGRQVGPQSVRGAQSDQAAPMARDDTL